MFKSDDVPDKGDSEFLSGATGLRLDVSDHALAIGLVHGFPMDFTELAVFDDALQHFWSFWLGLALVFVRKRVGRRSFFYVDVVILDHNGGASGAFNGFARDGNFGIGHIVRVLSKGLIKTRESQCFQLFLENDLH